jgi:hypothetical protein
MAMQFRLQTLVIAVPAVTAIVSATIAFFLRRWSFASSTHS